DRRLPRLGRLGAPDLVGRLVDDSVVDVELAGQHAEEALAADRAQIEIGAAERGRPRPRRDFAALALKARAHLPPQGGHVASREIGMRRTAAAQRRPRDVAPGPAKIAEGTLEQIAFE